MADTPYQVIARRWRPKSFQELVGQEHIVKTLANAIKLGRIAHAYLFVGPRGTGKTSTARLFAKCLNCEEGPTITHPQSSPICDAIMQGSCMDVIEIDGASNNSVDQVRELRDDCQYAPAQCRYKIYIIDEVHMLSTAAFNALLKTLEEPPAHVKFIFATTEAHKVLPTITSRCQRFEFRPISQEVIAEKLSIIAKAEGIEASEDALAAIARLAQGGMRDAQSIFDQLISFCGKTITADDVVSVYGLASEQEVQRIAEALVSGETKALIDEAKALCSQGKDLYKSLRDLKSFLQEKLLQAVSQKAPIAIGSQACSEESLTRVLDVLQAGESSVKFGLSEQVNFEVLLLKASHEGQKRSIELLIKELAAIAKGLPEQAPEAQKKSPQLVTS